MANPKEIYFLSAQAAENGDYEDLRPLQGGRLSRVWDDWDDKGVLQNLASPEVVLNFFRARVLHHSNRSIIPEANRPTIFNDPIDIPLEELDGWDVFILSLWGNPDSEQRFRNQFLGWLELITVEAEEVGGDDSFYDYYPDKWEVARQIASALGMEEEYNRKREVVVNGPYKEEPDYIPNI